MVWKKRKKPLTAQEAVSLLTEQLAPYWVGSSPIIAGLWINGSAVVHALKPDFNEKLYGICFVDFTSFSVNQAIEYLNALTLRFQDAGLQFILAIRSSFSELLNSPALHSFSESHSYRGSIMMDTGAAVANAYGVSVFPAMTLIEKGKIVGTWPLFEATKSGSQSLEGSSGSVVEQKIRELLWTRDPGLPLFPPMTISKYRECADLEASYVLKGNWLKKEKSAVSLDEKSTLEFSCLESQVALIARAEALDAYFWIKANHVPVFEINRSSALKVADRGETFFSPSPSGFTPLLKGAKKLEVEICGKGLEVYGLRFSSS